MSEPKPPIAPAASNDAPASQTSPDPVAPSEDAQAPYEVGYGKPPREHQFRNGDGRKRGRRPKGSQNVKTLLRQEHSRMVRLRGKDGRVQTKSALAALIQKDVADAFEKERVRARQIAMAMQLDAEDEAKASLKAQVDLGGDDAAILARYLPAALPASPPAPKLAEPPAPKDEDQS